MDNHSVISYLSIAITITSVSSIIYYMPVFAVFVSVTFLVIKLLVLLFFQVSDLNFINVFWFFNLNEIWERMRNTTESVILIEGKHNLDLNTHDSLFEEDVSDGVVDEIVFWLTGTDHETVFELHSFK